MTPKADVMIVGRDRVQIDTFRQLLRGMGVWTVAYATEATAALEQLRASRPSAIFVCEGMKGQDALDFIKLVRRDISIPSRRGHILFVGPSELHAKAINAGVHAAANLPISLAGLMQVMAFMKSDDRPFVELQNYVGPCRRTKRMAGKDVPRRRGDDRLALEAQLRHVFKEQRQKLIEAALTAAQDPSKTDAVFFAVMDLERTSKEMDDQPVIDVIRALSEALSRRATVDIRLSAMIEEFMTAVGHLAQLPREHDRERQLLAGHITALAGRIGQRSGKPARAAAG